MSEKTKELIRKVCNDLAEHLCAKNDSYGDSAITPLRLRSKASRKEQILVRQDDKLSRLFNRRTFVGDNDLFDLVGYWVLEQVIDILDAEEILSRAPESNEEKEKEKEKTPFEKTPAIEDLLNELFKEPKKETINANDNIAIDSAPSAESTRCACAICQACSGFWD